MIFFIGDEKTGTYEQNNRKYVRHYPKESKQNGTGCCSDFTTDSKIAHKQKNRYGKQDPEYDFTLEIHAVGFFPAVFAARRFLCRSFSGLSPAI